MERFDRQIQTALRLITKNGEKCKWRVEQEGDISNPDQPWIVVEPVNEIVFDVEICFLPINNRYLFESRSYQKGNELPKGAVLGLMPFYEGLKPSSKDVAIRGGKEYRIYSFDELKPNHQTIMYEIIFKTS